jgi:hypothetical protein
VRRQRPDVSTRTGSSPGFTVTVTNDEERRAAFWRDVYTATVQPLNAVPAAPCARAWWRTNFVLTSGGEDADETPFFHGDRWARGGAAFVLPAYTVTDYARAHGTPDGLDLLGPARFCPKGRCCRTSHNSAVAANYCCGARSISSQSAAPPRWWRRQQQQQQQQQHGRRRCHRCRHRRHRRQRRGLQRGKRRFWRVHQLGARSRRRGGRARSAGITPTSVVATAVGTASASVLDSRVVDGAGIRSEPSVMLAETATWSYSPALPRASEEDVVVEHTGFVSAASIRAAMADDLAPKANNRARAWLPTGGDGAPVPCVLL